IPLIFFGFSRMDETIFLQTDIEFPGFHGFAVSMLGIGIFVAGLLTVAQFSFWGNYLPHVFPVHLRGTGESFAANIGGRMLGTPFAYVTQAIATLGFIPGASPAAKTAIVAAGVAFVLILCNLLLSCLLPEPGVNSIDDLESV